MDFSDPRYALKAKGFLLPINMPFEDTTIPTSSNYREDLSIQYANLQKYPNKSKRLSKHQASSIFDLEKPFSYYQKEYNNLPNWIKNIIQISNHNEGTYFKDATLLQTMFEKEKSKNQELELLLKSKNQELELLKLKNQELESILSSKSFIMTKKILAPYIKIRKKFTK